MRANKTQPLDTSVEEFLSGVANETRQRDARAFAALAAEVIGQSAVMWGTSIVGFGSLHYRYDSGREGDTMVVGFAPRAAALVIYGLLNSAPELAHDLGPHTTGKGCLYVKDLSKIDTDVLRHMIDAAWTAKNSHS